MMPSAREDVVALSDRVFVHRRHRRAATALGVFGVTAAMALLEAISQPLGEDVQVDLAGVTFLDCAGLGALIAASNAARTRARRFVVTNPSGAARRILEICYLLDP